MDITEINAHEYQVNAWCDPRGNVGVLRRNTVLETPVQLRRSGTPNIERPVMYPVVVIRNRLVFFRPARPHVLYKSVFKFATQEGRAETLKKCHTIRTKLGQFSLTTEWLLSNSGRT